MWWVLGSAGEESREVGRWLSVLGWSFGEIRVRSGRLPRDFPFLFPGASGICSLVGVDAPAPPPGCRVAVFCGCPAPPSWRRAHSGVVCVELLPSGACPGGRSWWPETLVAKAALLLPGSALEFLGWTRLDRVTGDLFRVGWGLCRDGGWVLTTRDGVRYVPPRRLLSIGAGGSFPLLAWGGGCAGLDMAGYERSRLVSLASGAGILPEVAEIRLNEWRRRLVLWSGERRGPVLCIDGGVAERIFVAEAAVSLGIAVCVHDSGPGLRWLHGAEPWVLDWWCSRSAEEGCLVFRRGGAGLACSVPGPGCSDLIRAGDG